jgi:hypothetical protein
MIYAMASISITQSKDVLVLQGDYKEMSSILADQ